MNPNITPKGVKNPFRYFCMNIGYIPTSYKECMDYYEQVLWLIKFLENKVIPAVDNNAAALTELQGLFVTLKDYVEHYFDNLDVQDEINNKLDEMASDGTLQEIIADYLNANALWCFDNISEMKEATNLINGSYARTLGYYEVNDGGEALYKIRTITNEDVVDEMFIIALNNENLIAELIIENNSINIRSLGAKSQDNQNNKYDIKDYVLAYVDYLDKCDNRVKLYIPSGFWHTTALNIDREKGFDIYGDETFPNNSVDGTIISSYSNNQNYILQIGGTTNYCRNWSLKNICFTTDDVTYNDNTFSWNFTPKTVGVCLNLIYALYGITDNLFFINIKGSALKISSSWENYFKLLNFRNINALNSAIMIFDEADTSLLATANITATNFEKLMFEATLGDLILSNIRSGFTNNHIGLINFEDNRVLPVTGEYETFTDETVFDEDTAIHQAIINNKGSFGCNIDSIEINNMSHHVYSEDGNDYAYDVIVAGTYNFNNILSTISKILINGMFKDSRVLYTTTERPYIASQLNIESIINGSTKKLYNDVHGFYKYSCKDINSGYGSATNKNKMINFSDIISTLNSEIDSRGYLYSDSNSINDNKIVVKAFTGIQSDLNKRYMRTTVLNNNLAIRAKVSNGDDLILTISDSNNTSNYKSLTIIGDGNYNIYKFENINDDLPIGTIIDIKPSGASANVGVDLYLDCLCFY